MREEAARWRPLSIALKSMWPGLWSHGGELSEGKLCLPKFPEPTTPAAVALGWHFRECVKHSIYLIIHLSCWTDYVFFLNVC